MRGGRVGCGDGVGTHDGVTGTCPGSGTFPGLRRSQSRITSYGDGAPVGDGVGPSTANGAGAPGLTALGPGGLGLDRCHLPPEVGIVLLAPGLEDSGIIRGGAPAGDPLLPPGGRGPVPAVLNQIHAALGGNLAVGGDDGGLAGGAAQIDHLESPPASHIAVAPEPAGRTLAGVRVRVRVTRHCFHGMF